MTTEPAPPDAATIEGALAIARALDRSATTGKVVILDTPAVVIIPAELVDGSPDHLCGRSYIGHFQKIEPTR